MTVKAILREKGGDVFAMSPEVTLREVARELTERNIGAVVILDGDELVGILSERDLVRRLARDGAGALERTAASAMTAQVETCHLADSIEDVMARMTASRFRHLPVVDGARLVGLVSIGDVVKRRIEKAVRDQEEMRAYILQT